MTMYNVHATWGMKLHSTVNDGASKDFYRISSLMNLTTQEMVSKTLIL